MMYLRRVVLVLTLLGLLALGVSHDPAAAEQIHFSLARGQAVTLGQYTLVFTGMTGTRPGYDLYVGSTLAARFPSATSSPSREYWFGNGSINIATSAVAADGTAARGTFTVR